MIRTKFLLIVPVALLISLAVIPTKWHLLLGIAAWAILRWGTGELHQSLGRARRWVQALVVLCLLGAIFGLVDTHTGPITWSVSGTLAGTTMVVRAYALVAMTSLASSLVPFRRMLKRIRNPLIQRVLELVILALNLVPVLIHALSTASTTLKERRPGFLKLPERLWLLAVHSSLRTAMLAENVALDIAIAAHNAGEDGKVTL